MSEINPKQITFARVRRRLTKAQLAKELGVTSRSIQNYEAGTPAPDLETLAKIAKLLNFPQQFFFIEDEMPSIGADAASFRSLSRMSDAMKNCALNAGKNGFRINEWIEKRFSLPQADLPDLSDLSPGDAAATLRRMWGLGSAPIPNMIHLLESKGIRVFSLVEEAREVDAFCTWYEGKPFVFLNTMKSAERSRFDAAHELGHLVRDVYSMRHIKVPAPEMEGQAGSPVGKKVDILMEKEADAFAAAFLMPEESIRVNKPPVFTIKYLLKLKRYWGVSLAALAYRYNALGHMTEWGYRNICIEIAKSGYRTNEPDPMEPESSQLLTKVFDFLQSQNFGRAEIAQSLHLSVGEINDLTFKLTRLSVVSGFGGTEASSKNPPKLRLV